MDFQWFDSLSRTDREKYALLVHAVQKIVFLADELIEQNRYLTKRVQELDGQGHHFCSSGMPTRDLVSALLRNCSSQRRVTGDQAKMEILAEAINNLSLLADLFVARNCHLIKRLYPTFGEDYFDSNSNDEGI
uniref:Rx_N domain-containing protein n=1 Tax=Globodera pallida TaxID=36090 RepID=A0A183C6E4_GLOPA